MKLKLKLKMTIIFMVIYAYDKYNIYVLDWMCTLELNSKQLDFFGGKMHLKNE